MPGKAGSSAAPQWEPIGTSREGRPVRAMNLGAVDRSVGDRSAKARRVTVIAGIHGDEQEGLRHLPEIIELLKDAPWDVRLIENASPDGAAAESRTTSTGVDPNRNWPSDNFRPSRRNGPRALSEPEIAAVHGDLLRSKPDLVIVLHSARSGPFVNFDGPAADEAHRFRAGAGNPWRVQPSMGYPTPGSLGSWVGVDWGVPILTIEFRRGSGPEESGPALLRGLRSVLWGDAGVQGPASTAEPMVVR